jgi:hypothetical protein
VKKSLLLTLAVMLLAVSFASAQEYKLEGGNFNQVSSPSQISSENYVIDGGVNTYPCSIMPQETWGSFPEASIWTGAWKNSEYDTGGIWANAKFLNWYTAFEKPENFGLGFKIRGDYGKILSNSDVDWGYVAPGPSLGYYRGITLRDSIETDVSILYRFDKVRDSGLMLDGHFEFDHIADYKNRFILQIDGNYFPDDSWAGPGIYLEHKLNKSWKIIPGVGASLSWLDGDFIPGFQPSMRLKYDNRWNFGVNANFTDKQGNFIGAILAYEFTPDITTWMESRKK